MNIVSLQLRLGLYETFAGNPDQKIIIASRYSEGGHIRDFLDKVVKDLESISIFYM